MTKIKRDIEINDNQRLMGIEELQTYLGLGRNRAMDFAQRSGAVVDIGFRRLLYDRYKIDKEIERCTRVCE